MNKEIEKLIQEEAYKVGLALTMEEEFLGRSKTPDARERAAAHTGFVEGARFGFRLGVEVACNEFKEKIKAILGEEEKK